MDHASALDVGVHESSLVLGKAVKAAMRSRTSSRPWATNSKGSCPSKTRLRRSADLADKKKHVFDEDIVALVDDGIVRGQPT